MIDPAVPAAATARARHVPEVLMSSALDTLERIDRLTAVAAECGTALLLIGGVDGKHHAGSREALNWLLAGLSGRDVFGASQLDSSLEEVVLLIEPQGSRLYAPADVWARLKTKLSRCRRLQVWTPPPSITDDSEAVEVHKIRSFIQMTARPRPPDASPAPTARRRPALHPTTPPPASPRAPPLARRPRSPPPSASPSPRRNRAWAPPRRRRARGRRWSSGR